MAMTAGDLQNEYAECTVCRSDTALLCSPCGDPVGPIGACPNGCEASLTDPVAWPAPSAAAGLEAAA
jgi:hypothetical protein